VSYEELHPGAVDAEVFMKNDATRAQLATVRRAIRQANAVDRFTLVDQDALQEAFARIFPDDPGLVREASRARIPVSFRIDFAEGARINRWITRVERLPGVRRATNSQELGTDDVVDLVAGCVSSEFTTELLRAIGDDQHLVNSIDPDALQVRLRFVVDPKAEPLVSTTGLEGLPGVDAILDRAGMCRRFGIALPAR
jgi:hypothetical protein